MSFRRKLLEHTQRDLLRLEKLQQFVTVCAWTGQVRFQGQWLRLDEFLERQFGISVSHSLSQEAAEKMMREIEELRAAQKETDKARQDTVLVVRLQSQTQSNVAEHSRT